MKIIDKLCEKYKIHEIELTDNSKYTCKDNTAIKIDLLLGRTLTHTLPYYSKFGFFPKRSS